MGVLYHVHFIDHFEWARTELIRDLGLTYRQIEDSGVFIQVVEVNARYHRPAFYDDELEITTIISDVPTTRLELVNEIRRVGEDDLLVTGRITLCFVDRDRMKPVRAPEYLAAAIRRELERAVS